MTGTITLRYDADDRYQRAEVAAIVRGDTERLRGILWQLREDLVRIKNGKGSCVGETGPQLSIEQAEDMFAWLVDECDGLPLSLED